MRNDILKAFFILWGVALFIELFWFGSMTSNVHTTSEIIFAVTVIAVTSVFGSVGIYLFKNSRD